MAKPQITAEEQRRVDVLRLLGRRGWRHRQAIFLRALERRARVRHREVYGPARVGNEGEPDGIPE